MKHESDQYNYFKKINIDIKTKKLLHSRNFSNLFKNQLPHIDNGSFDMHDDKNSLSSISKKKNFSDIGSSSNTSFEHNNIHFLKTENSRNNINPGLNFLDNIVIKEDAGENKKDLNIKNGEKNKILINIKNIFNKSNFNYHKRTEDRDLHSNVNNSTLVTKFSINDSESNISTIDLKQKITELLKENSKLKNENDELKIENNKHEKDITKIKNYTNIINVLNYLNNIGRKS